MYVWPSLLTYRSPDCLYRPSESSTIPSWTRMAVAIDIESNEFESDCMTATALPRLKAFIVAPPPNPLDYLATQICRSNLARRWPSVLEKQRQDFPCQTSRRSPARKLALMADLSRRQACRFSTTPLL